MSKQKPPADSHRGGCNRRGFLFSVWLLHFDPNHDLSLQSVNGLSEAGEIKCAIVSWLWERWRFCLTSMWGAHWHLHFANDDWSSQRKTPTQFRNVSGQIEKTKDRLWAAPLLPQVVIHQQHYIYSTRWAELTFVYAESKATIAWWWRSETGRK